MRTWYTNPTAVDDPIPLIHLSKLEEKLSTSRRADKSKETVRQEDLERWHAMHEDLARKIEENGVEEFWYFHEDKKWLE